MRIRAGDDAARRSRVLTLLAPTPPPIGRCYHSPMPLLPTLRAEAERRGLIEPGEDLNAARLFDLVRDMPYRRASSRQPEITIREWRGTCSGKHYLLKVLLEEFGLHVILIAATHEYTAENIPWAPPELRAFLDDAPVPDVHNFLRVEIDPFDEANDWMTVDATWPLAARALGLPANERWVEGRDMRVAADPIELFHVPEETPFEEQAQQFKQRIIEREFGAQVERRDRFIEAMGRWLAEATTPDAAP